MQEQAATTTDPRADPSTRTGLLDRPKLLLGIAVGLHLGLFLLLMTTQILPHNRWYWPSDDQNRCYGFAKGVVENHLVPQAATVGCGVFLVPFAAATDFVLQASPAVVLTELALGVGATVLIYRAGERLLGRRAALGAAAVWLVLPLFGLLYLPTSHAPAAIWLGSQIGVDYPAALLGAAVMAVASGSRTDRGISRGIVLGAIGGLNVLVKPPGAIVMATALIALLVWRRYAAAIAAGLVATCVVAPQFVYNARLFGNPASFAYTPTVARRYLPQFTNLVGGTFSLGNLPRAYGRLILHNVTGPVVLIAIAIAVYLTWRRYPAARWLVVAQVVAFSLFYGFYRYGIGDTIVRYMTPALPAIALAAGAALAGDPPGEGPVRAQSPRAGAVVAIALVLAGSAALSAWIAVATPAPNIVVVGRTQASVRGRTVTVSWRPPSAPADLSYYVLRSRERFSTATVRGFSWLPLPRGRSVGLQATTSTDHPPGRGTWWYRPLIAPGARDQGWPPGPPVAALPAVRVVVR